MQDIQTGQPTMRRGKRWVLLIGAGLLVGVFAAIGVAVVWFFIMYGAASGVASAVNSDKPAKTVEEIEADFERTLEGDANLGALYRQFREDFPADYHGFVHAVAEEHAAGRLKNSADTARVVAGKMQEFRVKHSPALRSADLVDLAAIADQRYAVTLMFQQTETPELCAAFSNYNLPPTFKASGDIQIEMMKLQQLTFKAIKSGMTGNAPIGELSTEQLDASDAALDATGLPAPLLAAYRDGSIDQHPASEQCTVGVAEAKAIAGMPIELSAYWTAKALTGL